MTTGILERFTNFLYGKVAEGSNKNLASEVFDDGGLNSTISSTTSIEFEVLDFPHLDSADYDIVDVSSLPAAEKTVNNEDVPLHASAEEAINNENVPSLASVEDDKSEILGDKDVSAPVDETVNNEEVPTSDPLEESDVDEFEIIEDINPPDSREKSIPASSYEINKSIAEIAGFNKEKLLEMCTFSKMTYGNDDEKLSKAGYKTRVELSKKEGYYITSFLYPDGREAGFVFIKGKEVTIAYRGTQGSPDMLADANTFFTVHAFLPEGGRVHKGFYNAFESSFAGLESILKSQAKAQNLEIKDLKINLTGHSMGGALAKVAALCLKKTEGAQDIHVATFGDPRVFDLTASERYNEVLGENTIRVTQHRQDPVPAVPQGCTGYAHVGAQLRVEKSPDHFVHQIDGYYKGIHNMEEGNFKSNNSVSLFYYPVKLLNIINCGIIGCAQRTIVNWFGNQHSTLTEKKWYGEALALSLAKAKKQSNTDLVEEEWELCQMPHGEAKKQTNTEISLSRVSQVAEESKGLYFHT
jgi:hypothetical protein